MPIRRILSTSASLAALAWSSAALAAPEPAATDVDAVVVTAAQTPFREKDASVVITETVSYNDLESMASDASIAAMLTQLPGISTVEDADQPRYVTVRGISPDLNYTSIDGLAIATVGESGAGTRRVNLQLIPADMSSKTNLTKTFSAEQDGGAIGGAIDIITRSAFDRKKRYFVADVYGIYSSYSGDDGSNAGDGSRPHGGGGFKVNFADRFGPDRQFGIVLSGRYEDRVRNSAKIWQDTKYYYSDKGVFLNGPDKTAGWNGLVVPYNLSFGSYTNHIFGGGGSGKLEWRPSSGRFYASLLAYDYKRRESSTMNTNDIYNKSAIYDQTAEGGREQINSIYTKWRYNQWARNNRGLLGRFDWSAGDSGLLSLRAGTTRESFKDIEPYIVARTYPSRAYVTYDSTGEMPTMVAVTPANTVLGSTYSLSTAQETYNFSAETMDDVRLDYSRNVGKGDRGLGLAAGLEWRGLEIAKNVDSTRYKASGSMTNWLYDPGYTPLAATVVFPWIKGPEYRESAMRNLVLDTTNTTYYSRVSDYAYDEDLATGYLSLHYATNATTYVAGLRYEDVKFTAHTPRIQEGVATGQVDSSDGGYDNLLPSFNMVHRFPGSTNLRFSASKTLGRPTPANIATAQNVSCGEDEDGGESCSITRGNPGLRPRKADNLDLTVEHYFNGAKGLVLLGYFQKDIKDDIFTLTTRQEIDGQMWSVRQPRNAAGSSIEGYEFALLNSDMKLVGQAFDASFNVVYMQGSMTYTADGVTRNLSRMLLQPDWIGNASLTWRMPKIGGGARVGVNYRSEFMSSIGTNPWEDQFNDELTTVNLSAWHRVAPGVTFKYEINNLFDKQPHYLVGENENYVRQVDEYGRGFYFHIVYSR